MLNNITIGRYYKTNSLVHHMHPLAKLLCVIIFIVTTFMVGEVIPIIILTSISIMIISLSNVPLAYYIKQISAIKVLLIFIIIINIILGTNYLITIFLIIRLILIAVYSSLLIFTTTTKEITYALQLFFSPLRILGLNSKKLAITISLALRYIPTIMESSHKILKAQASRGIDYNNSNIKNKFLAIKAMILPIFITSFKKADELSDMMELRLYDVTIDYHKNYKYNWNYVSIYMPIMHLLILLALIMKEVII